MNALKSTSIAATIRQLPYYARYNKLGVLSL